MTLQLSNVQPKLNALLPDNTGSLLTLTMCAPFARNHGAAASPPDFGAVTQAL